MFKILLPKLFGFKGYTETLVSPSPKIGNRYMYPTTQNHLQMYSSIRKESFFDIRISLFK